jgi:hypothetical protein
MRHQRSFARVCMAVVFTALTVGCAHDVAQPIAASKMAPGQLSTLQLSPPQLPTSQFRDQILRTLEGQWSNRAQFAAAPAALKVPPSVQGEWLDLQHARFMRVDAPHIGEHVLYLEWRSSGEGNTVGAISRQRIWRFRTAPDNAENVVLMDFYAFVDGKAWAGKTTAADARAAFRDLSLTALRGYEPTCALRFVGDAKSFAGEVTAAQCSLVAASGRKMGIDARVVFKADGTLEYKESGRLEDGRYAFRVPPTEPYRFVRE